MNEVLARFLSQAGSLPSLPAVYHELQAAMADAYTSVEDIGAIIRRDHSLAMRLLRLANSAFYGLPGRVETLEEGLYVIGLREMGEMALATTVITTFVGVPTLLIDAEGFWRHSVACGMASSLLAEERRDAIPERLFVGGLLHDIGRLVVLLKAPRESVAILERCRATGALDTEVEREVLGFDHAEVGAALLERWNLPLGLVEMVRCHHEPTAARGPGAEVAVVHVADFLASLLDWGFGGEYAVAPLSEEGWVRCRVEEGRVRAVVGEVEARCDALCEVFAVGPSSEGRVHG